MSKESMINIKNISKYYYSKKNKIKIFSSLNININKGESISIIGPNGCGKTTLLNIISKIDKSYQGKLEIKGNSSSAYMFQKDLLIPWRNILHNVTIGLEVQSHNNEENNIKIKKLLKDFHLLSRIEDFPDALSGGERQKVAFIRTIILDTDILLMDEPFSAIDFNSKIKMYQWFLNYIKQGNKTTLIVTHDIEEAILLSDRVIILGNKTDDIIYNIKIDIDKSGVKYNPIRIKQDKNFSIYLAEIWNKLEKYKKDKDE